MSGRISGKGKQLHGITKAVLQILASHQLYAKMSKCVFATNEVEYLGHIISEEGVKTDPKKIDAMVVFFFFFLKEQNFVSFIFKILFYKFE